MAQTFAQISPTRRIAAALLLLGIIGSAAFSWAAVQDTLIHTNNFAVLSVDLKASTDGTTYTDATSIDWALDPTPNAVTFKPLQVKNAGTGQSTVSFAITGPNAPTSLNGGAFRVYEVASMAACDASTSGTVLYNGLAGIDAGSGNLTAPLAPAGTQWLCMRYTTAAAGLSPVSLTYSHTITFTSTSI